VERLRIILVEDNPDDRLLIRRELEGSFENVQIAEIRDTGEFQAELAAMNFDLVITDFQLNWTNGIEVLKAIKQRDAYMPVIMFTGSGSQDVAVKAMHLGLDDYVLKGPGQFVRLPAAIRASLAHVETRRNAADLQRAVQESERRYRELARERAELLAESEEVNRLKDEFLAMVSHELRTPLTSILGWARLVKTKNFSPHEVQKAVDSINRNAESLLRTVNDLLDVSALISGGLQLHHEEVDVPAILRSAVESIRPVAESKQVRLELEASCDVSILGDASRLHQALLNLLSNAVKFTERHGSISVACEVTDSLLKIEVMDTGIGIDPKFLPYVFDRFRQANGTLSRKEGGLGLGLAIVREIVQRHHGSVNAQSNGPAKGARFTVTLPIEVQP